MGLAANGKAGGVPRGGPFDNNNLKIIFKFLKGRSLLILKRDNYIKEV